MRPGRALPTLALLAVVGAMLTVPGTAAGSGSPPDAVVDYALDVDAAPVVIDVLANDTDGEGDALVLVPRSGTTDQGGTFNCAGTSCTYTPPSPLPQADYDSFLYLVSDGTSVATGTAVAIFVPHTPEAVADEVFVYTAGAVTVDVLANDTHPQGLPLSVVPGSQTLQSGGTVDCSSTQCVYTPPSPPPISDSFTYVVSDGLRTSEGQVTLYDGRPQVGDDNVAWLGTPTLDVDVLANDTSPAGNPLSVVPRVGAPTAKGGTVDCDALGCTYTPPFPVPTEDSFHYEATDGVVSAEAMVTIDNLVCVDPTDALDDNGLIVTHEWLSCTGLSSNANEADFTPLLPSTGASSLVMTSGTVAAGRAPNDGPDSFGQPSRHHTYRGAYDVQVLRLDLDVPPTATCLAFDYVFGSDEYPEYIGGKFDDGFVAELDAHTWSTKSFKVDAPDTFVRDSDGQPVTVQGAYFRPDQVVEATGTEYDGSTPRVTAVTPITGGLHSLYLSVFDGVDSVVDSGVVIDDLRVGTDPAGGCLGGGEPDVFVDDDATTDEDTPVDIDVLANDSLPPGATPTVAVGDQPAFGTATCAPSGLCTYVPDPDASGTDSFTYTVDDGLGGVGSATVTVTVTPINDDPTAVDDDLAVRAGAVASVNVLDNDVDVDGDDLEVTAHTDGADGTVSCSADGECTYTSTGATAGVDTFTYTVEDGNGGSASATVRVAIGPGNSPPDALDDEAATDEDEFAVVEVLANDTDADGDPLELVAVSDPSHGTVECSSAGTCTYTPERDFSGEDTFTYGVEDGAGGTADAVVRITVRPVNDPPVAVNDALATTAGVAATVDVLANDTDVDGDVLSVELFGQGANGAVSCTPEGQCTYTPDPGFTGHDGFLYLVNDGADGRSIAGVAVSVDAPPAVCTDELTMRLNRALSGSTTGCVLGGDVVIESDVFGARSIKGTVAVASFAGGAGQATVTFDLTRILFANAYVGEVRIEDPAAGISATAVSALAPLNSWGTTVQGSLRGLTGPGLPRLFGMDFTVTDFGVPASP